MPLKDPEARKAYLREYAKRNREAAYERVKKWRAENPEAKSAQSKRYQAKNPEKCAEKAAKWAQLNPEKIKQIRRTSSAKARIIHAAVIKTRKAEYAKNNCDVINAAVARRKAAKLMRTPKWLDQTFIKEIEFTYTWCAALRSCGLNYHVDHVVPLQGETVSGLHVPWNLQVIPASENIRKRNRWANE